MSKLEMVRAYTESLLKQVLNAERVMQDPDGDYPVRYESALYYVRVDPRDPDDPVVQIFAVVLAGAEAKEGLFEALNGINSRLRFARAFHVADQVLIETEIPGEALSLAGFANACIAVAKAADAFGPRLAESFGGKTAFADEQGPGYRPPEQPSWDGYL